MNEAVNILPDYTPDYVLDEVQYYFNKIEQGKNDCFTLDNAISLVNLAMISSRINKIQRKIQLIAKVNH